ncbi:MAG: D-alanine--D-alanine ligase [Gemmatimonadetes bacterium]|nr:D-alanine--D-alanine ligase [Gemmatimonadota bacterium]
MKITVLTGGESDEREVSLASGCQVSAALRERGHDVVVFDTVTGPLSAAREQAIRAEGVPTVPPGTLVRDRVLGGDLSFLRDDPVAGAADVYFLALHGGGGEDGRLQALLEAVGTPYTGSGMVGCALAMDKELSKRLLRDAGIDTPDWLMGEPSRAEIEARLGWPVVVKAACGGSSLRLELVHGPAEWPAAVERSRAFGDRVVVEAFVEGREFTVGVVAGEALPVGEIIAEHELFDYECKYQPGMAQEIFPADIDAALAHRLCREALRAHDVLRLDDYSRVDFMVTADGRVYCLEANALPGMTANSLLPRAAAAAGSSFPLLCERIAMLAVERRRS